MEKSYFRLTAEYVTNYFEPYTIRPNSMTISYSMSQSPDQKKEIKLVMSSNSCVKGIITYIF